MLKLQVMRTSNSRSWSLDLKIHKIICSLIPNKLSDMKNAIDRKEHSLPYVYLQQVVHLYTEI
jgi:hypothetical protein